MVQEEVEKFIKTLMFKILGSGYQQNEDTTMKTDHVEKLLEKYDYSIDKMVIDFATQFINAINNNDKMLSWIDCDSDSDNERQYDNDNILNTFIEITKFDIITNMYFDDKEEITDQLIIISSLISSKNT